MLVERITSRQNPLVKRFRRVRMGSERHHVFIEGMRLVEDALRAGAHFESVAYTIQLETSERGLALLDELQHVPCRGANVSQQVMEAIADTENPQGVAAIVSRPFFELEDLFTGGPDILIIADQLQDPGNLGTIIRTAEAAGASCLITTRYTVDPYNQKAMRASMGSALRLPIATDAELSDVVARCRERSIKLIASMPESSRPQATIEDAAVAQQVKAHTDADLKASFALMLGSEADGISDGAAALADELIYIPMAAGVESLNVAAAAAVLLYEAARQRKFDFSKE